MQQLTPAEQESIRKGRMAYSLLLASVVVVPLLIALTLFIVPHYSGGVLQMTPVYPTSSLLLAAITGSLGYIVGKGISIRYLWLVANMIQTVYLAFLSFQLFRYSLGLGYLAIAGCVGVLGAGFYSFYQPDIQFYLRSRQQTK